MSETETTKLTTLNAAVWAHEFSQRVPQGACDPEMLRRWFGMALMAGYDAGRSYSDEELARREKIITLRDESIQLAYNRIRDLEHRIATLESVLGTGGSFHTGVAG